jgi:hypothetical protein
MAMYVDFILAKGRAMKKYTAPKAECLVNLTEEVMTDTSLNVLDNYDYEEGGKGGIVIEFN